MAAKDRLSKASEAAREVTANRYVHRLLEDEVLRANLISAYDAARGAYGRMSNGKPVTEALFEDRKLQAELQNVIASLRDAGEALRDTPAVRPKRRRRLGRSLMIATVGSALALALSKGLRTKVLDMLFGAEEKFDYTSTTAPNAAAEPAGVANA